MHDLAFMAAQQWAQAHASRHADPVEFGAKVAQVYLAAKVTRYHAGDAVATAAELAALSIPGETLQALERLCALLSRFAGGTSRVGRPDELGAA